MYQPEVFGAKESIPPPLRPVQGLTLAKSSQLSMDCLANPEAFDQLQVFCGKYIDERLALGKLFEAHTLGQKALSLAQSEYDHVWQTFDPRYCTSVGKATLKSAGMTMRETKDMRRQDTELLYFIADRFSITFAEFCQERLRGAHLLLMGVKYDYDHGYITTTVPAEPIPKPVIFGNMDIVKARNIEQIQYCPSRKYDPSKTLVRMAKDSDWIRLLASLGSIAKF